MKKIKTISRFLRLNKPRKTSALLLGNLGSFQSINLNQVEQDLREIVRFYLDRDFSSFYESLSFLGRTERALLLSEIFSHASLSKAWVQLSWMVQERIFPIILTTCYDNLLERGLSQIKLVPRRDYDSFIIGVNREDEFRDFLRSAAPCKIIKLHGDLGFGAIRLTTKDTVSFSHVLSKPLKELTDAPLVVLGYEERHSDVLEILEKRSNASFWWVSPSGLHWKKRADRPIIQAMLERNSDENIISGEEGEFARFISSLWTQVNISSSPAHEAPSVKTSSPESEMMISEEPPLPNHLSNINSVLKYPVGLPPDFYQELREVMLNCGSFSNAIELDALFVDARIRTWRHRIPNSYIPMNRVNALIGFLVNRYNDLNENALVLFLRVLSDSVTSGDACSQRLSKLANELENIIEYQGE